ncbi:MAG: hypothetical protein CMB73_03045 [Euryarchaeota archaeon]|nr:hypothetical protein [Euryarchaeota archaeon]|tara:strand:- start:25035 stop:25235 length:201 start_codon:yes stop_codon:yes gene_type:complete
MREQMIEALRKYAEGNIAMHKANVEVYLNRPAGIGEHPQVMEELTEQLKKMAEWDDVINMIDEYLG